MLNLKAVTFTTKLFTGILLILVLAITSLVVVTESLVDDGLHSLGKDALENVSKSVVNSLATQNAMLLEKLETDMVILEKELEKYGSFDLDSSMMTERTITNQVTKVKEQVKIPKLMLGGTVMNGNTGIVDKVQMMTNGAATIFQVLDDKLLRVSTNVRINETDRAVDTYIPADSPVYKAVMAGDTYSGRAFVVNDWYVVRYTPVRNGEDKIVAVLFVGRKILVPALRDMITSTKAAGVGYFFLYDSKGAVILHPTLEGKNLFEHPSVGSFFRDHKGGFLEYFWNGENKITYTQFFEPWDWHIGVGLNESQMVRGLDKKIIISSIVAGAGALVIGIVIAILLIRAIAKPLNQLAAQSLKVAEGDYTVVFNHVAKDAIGHLAEALNSMVNRTKNMLVEITSATQSLTAASSELSATSGQMTNTSTRTADMTEAVSTSAAEVNDSMNSVSAAIEQASVNLGTVAAAAEEMSATIQEIAQNSERAKNTTSSAVVKASDASHRVNELGAAAKEISAVTAAIAAISSQTNLLALNATIEAARAGEAGRGFAVVANEIKELAQQTAKATGDIHDKITGIQAVTTQTVHDISDITGVIGEMNDIVGTIAAAVEEQSVTTRDIAENVGQTSTGISEISTNVATSTSMTRAISSDIENVRSAAGEMTTSSRTVQGSATELFHLAERLRDQVSRFKI